MQKRNEIANVNATVNESLKSDELSLEALLSEQASELPEKALMRHRRRHHGFDSDYCYYRYDYCYPYYCSDYSC